MKKLNTLNYHSPENNYLTTSKIKDFLLDEYYCWQKHVERSIIDEKTDALIIGSMVDTALTDGVLTMQKLYVPVARRSKDGGGGLVTEVTSSMWEEANNLISAVMNTTAYKELEDYKRQVILTMPIPKNKWFGDKFVGMLDYLKVDEKNKSAEIVDLKTSRSGDPKKYWWASLDLGYWLQAAAYVKLVSHNFDIPLSNIKFKHLVVEKDAKGINRVRVFEFDHKLIEDYVVILESMIKTIINKTEFKKADCSLSNAIMLTDPRIVQLADESEWETESV